MTPNLCRKMSWNEDEKLMMSFWADDFAIEPTLSDWSAIGEVVHNEVGEYTLQWPVITMP